MSNKKASQDRKARLAEVQKAQKAKEKKVVVGIVVAIAVLLAGLTGVVAFAINDANSQKLPNLGATAAAASCDPVTTDKGEGTGEHVDTRVDYETVPPSHGAHFAAPAVSDRKFYTAADRPELETLVHNLEHGYTVLWFDGDKAKGKEQLLRDIAAQGNKQDTSRRQVPRRRVGQEPRRAAGGQALRAGPLDQGRRRQAPDVRRPLRCGDRRLRRAVPRQRHPGAGRRLTRGRSGAGAYRRRNVSRMKV